MAEVKFVGVTKEFEDTNRGKVRAVNESTFTVHDKEFLVFVGPSGCGKTTSLRMIAGMERQTYGDIIIDDRIVNKVHPKDRDIAMVFQDYALYPHMTIRENLSFGLKNLKKPKDYIEQKVNEAARILKIEPLLERKPRELSGGQRQRVAVGRAIVRDPKVFLFDEPLSNLDAKLRVQMRIELAELHKRLEATIIYVTHDQVEAMTLGDRIVVMNQGEIQQISTPEELYAKPRNMFVAGFIGSPPMNFMKATLDGTRVMAEGLEFTLSAEQAAAYKAYNGREVVFGIRPEDIQPVQDGQTNKPNVMPITLKAMEHLGSERLAYFDVDNERITAKFSAEYIVAVGAPVHFEFNVEKASLFDPQTELRIER